MPRINLLTMDGTDLSDHGRTFSQSRVDKIVQLELANGNRKQYVKGVKYKFTLEWNWLPSASVQTADAKAGRDVLKALCFDGNTHTLVVRDVAAGTTNTYTVFVDSYSEDILRRDYTNDVYWYRVSVELSQQ